VLSLVVMVCSDATIYRPNDISSRYWPYRIDIVKKNIEISIYRYRFNVGKTTSMLSIYFIFEGNKSMTAHCTYNAAWHTGLTVTQPC